MEIPVGARLARDRLRSNRQKHNNPICPAERFLMSQPKPNFYNLAWRWHFYAGLFVAPFMVMLALTGIIYLFKPCLLYTSPSPRDATLSRMPSSA